MKEWTANLNRRLKLDDRIDKYGGYVYDSGDIKPTTNNAKEFTFLNYKLDFPIDQDLKQYYLMHTSNRLLARYIFEKNIGNARAAFYPATVTTLPDPKTSTPIIVATSAWDQVIATASLVSDVYVAAGGTNTGSTEQNVINAMLALGVHSPIIGVSYDGVPIYASTKVYSERFNVNSPLEEIKSQYKLKYTEVTSSTAGAIGPFTVSDGQGGTNTKYVTLDRSGGPSLTEYPIGSFIEDYEFVAGVLDTGALNEHALDEHNGRFSLTPDFPAVEPDTGIPADVGGRYCYFATTKSFDTITNELVSSCL